MKVISEPQDQDNENIQMSAAAQDATKEETKIDKAVLQTSANKHRERLLRKLTYEKIWLTPAEKPKPYETAIIFDWDDTLLCTSFINPSGVY